MLLSQILWAIQYCIGAIVYLGLLPQI